MDGGDSRGRGVQPARTWFRRGRSTLLVFFASCSLYQFRGGLVPVGVQDSVSLSGCHLSDVFSFSFLALPRAYPLYPSLT